MNLKKFFFSLFSILSIIGYGYFVFAAAPSGGYNPGQTLNPDCAPGDVDCIVTLPTGSSVTADNGLTATSGNVQLGGVLNKSDFYTLIDGSGYTQSLEISGLDTAFFESNKDFFVQSNDRVIIKRQGGTSLEIGQDIRMNFGMSGALLLDGVSGSLGQVLVSNGPGTAPAWATISGGSGWGLTGNNGTTPGTNFIGTTDAQDFVVKTNGSQIARFGQNGNVAIGADLTGLDPSLVSPTATNFGSMAFQSGQSTGFLSSAFQLGTASGDASTAFGFGVASGTYATAWGGSEPNYLTGPVASGYGATAFGGGTTASGVYATVFGEHNYARSYSETAFGINSTDYTPNSISVVNFFDRLLTIGNGLSGNAHNAYTLWKDGSFAYNDDNFQNDNPGTEQNMFYFNYGNHDGLGNVNTKRAIRLGSALNDEWDINSANVGDRSIAIGFGSAIASGDYSISLGIETEATGLGAIAWGEKSEASGIGSTAWGDSRATVMLATAFGNQSEASGEISTAIGSSSRAHSYAEFAIGSRNTEYIPNSISSWDNSDRLFIVGNGDITNSDAFTILKNGKVGIGIDNFEDTLNQLTPNTALLQVSGDIAASGDVYAAGVALTSDARLKTNVQDLNQGLDTVLNLRPVSYDMIRDGSHQLGFIAQEIQNELPMLVHDNGYLSLNYIGLTPVIVKAIQEMNLNITELTNMERPNTWRDSLIAWFGNVGNGITDFFAKRVTTDELCVGTVCVTQDQFLQMVQQSGQIPVVQTPSPDPQPADTPTEDMSSGQPVTDTVSPSDTPASTENTDIETSDTPPSDSSSDTPSDSGIDTETVL